MELGLDWELSARDVKEGAELGTKMWNDGYDKVVGGVYKW